MAEAAGRSSAWSRRQFLARGGALVGAFAVAGLLPARAVGDAPGQLTSEELAVVGALGSAILAAVGKPASQGPALGLRPPQAIADGFGALDPFSRTTIAGMLEAIDRAPSSGTFSALSETQRQAFIAKALAAFALPEPSSSTMAALTTFQQEADADYDQYLSEVEAGSIPDEIDQPSGPEAPDPPLESPQTFPVTPPPPPDVVLGTTVLAGLELVAMPLTALPSAPALLPLPPEVIASLTDLLLGTLPGTDVPQSLIEQLTEGLDAAEADQPPPPRPAPVLGEALKAWIPTA